jgi:hypothetical protein
METEIIFSLNVFCRIIQRNNKADVCSRSGSFHKIAAPAGATSNHAIQTTSNLAVLHQAVRLNTKISLLFSAHGEKPDK